MTDFEVKVYSQYGIPQFIEYFKDKFEDIATCEAYNEYLKFWKGDHVSKVAFSKYVSKFAGYKIINKTICNKKYRLFVKSR